MICRSTNIRAALRSRQRGFLLNPFRFAAPATSDPHFSSVILLLHGNGADESTTITDSSNDGRTPTVTGSVKVDADQSKFGGSSLRFSGADYLAYAPDAADDFQWQGKTLTVECWFRLAAGAAAGSPTIFSAGASSFVYVKLFVDGGALKFQEYYYGAANTTFGAINEEQWYHVAIAHNPTATVGFLDGVQKFSRASVFGGSGSELWIGVNRYSVSATKFVGHIDDFRYTKGISRYATAFAPPSEEFPSS